MNDQELIARARELAAVQGTAAVNELFPGWNDNTAAYVEAFGTAQQVLAELADRFAALAAIGARVPQPAVQDVIAVAWCKGCERGTASVRCPRCGVKGSACVVCLRCPPCDGDLPAEEE